MSTSNYLEAAETAKTPKHWSKAARKRILVVEDDRLSQKVLRQLLAARGYDVLQASGGWDAINRARHERPDLILMDLRLPDISGLDATRLLKMDDQTKNIPIIAVTAFATPSFEATAYENGCDAYIAKPIDIENLLGTLESL
jgi:two-component system cell cycle response regulator DivK